MESVIEKRKEERECEMRRQKVRGVGTGSVW